MISASLSTKHQIAICNCARPPDAPCERGSHRIVGQMIVRFLKHRTSHFTVDTNKQLRSSLSGNSGLNIDDSAIT